MLYVYSGLRLEFPKAAKVTIELYDGTNRLETLEDEPEEDVDTDEKGTYIVQGEVEKAIKGMKNRKATGDDDVPGDVLKVMGEVGLKTLKKINQNHI